MAWGAFGMKKQIKLGVVALFAVLGLVFLMGEPIEGLNWFSVMFWKSVLGFGCWGVCVALYRYWNEDGELSDDDYNDEL